jgi:hypothetical protein
MSRVRATEQLRSPCGVAAARVAADVATGLAGRLACGIFAAA